MGTYGLALAMLMAVSPAAAEWLTYVGGATGEKVIPSPPHRLSYFQGKPCPQEDDGSSRFQCGAPVSLHFQTGTRTILQTAGTIDHFTVYDLQYFSPDSVEPDQRSVLVGIGADEVHEVHARGNTIGGSFSPIRIRSLGQQPMIEVNWEDGGNAHFVQQDYLLLKKSGAILLDFTPVVNAARLAIPADMVTYRPTETFDLSGLVYSVGAFRRDSPVGGKVACCTARIDVQFQIANGRVVPGKSTYIPDWP